MLDISPKRSVALTSEGILREMGVRFVCLDTLHAQKNKNPYAEKHQCESL